MLKNYWKKSKKFVKNYQKFVDKIYKKFVKKIYQKFVKNHQKNRFSKKNCESKQTGNH